MTAVEPAPTVWMNVTTSVGWTRPPVGIVRVERALAGELQALLGTERFKLCTWRDERFVEWVGDLTTSTPEPLGKALDLFLPPTPSFDLARPFVLRALQRFAERPGASPDAPPSVRSAVPTDRPARAHPIRGDFVISAGLDWDNRYTERFHAMARRQGLRIITCCYDLIPVLFPQYCVGEVAKKFTEYFLQLCWGSEAVLCISQQSERDFTRLCSSLGAPTRPTVVIPLGDSVPSHGGQLSDEVRQLSRKPFILFVSTIERRKNHEVLYRAYHQLARRGLASRLPRLVFVGMPGWGTGDLLKDIELDPLTQGLVVQLHHVSDSELNHLYQQALFCVYPSLYEGWGLPVAEALAMGKAVLSSNAGSLPEVGADLVRYVEPWDVSGWAEAMWEWIERPHLVREVEREVKRRYQLRQWSDTACVVRDLIDELATRRPTTLELSPGYDMSSQVGVHLGPAIQAAGAAGLLLFGPHWSLAPGAYEVRVFGGIAGTAPQRATFEAVTRSASVLHAQLRVELGTGASDATVAILRFSLTQAVDDFEVRCIVDEGSSLKITRVEIGFLSSRTQAEPAGPKLLAVQT